MDPVSHDAGKQVRRSSPAPMQASQQQGEGEAVRPFAPARAQSHTQQELPWPRRDSKPPAAAEAREPAPPPSGDRRSRRHSSESSDDEIGSYASCPSAPRDSAGECKGEGESKRSKSRARGEGEGEGKGTAAGSAGVRATRAPEVEPADERDEVQQVDSLSPVANIAPQTHPYVRDAAAGFKFKVITAPRTLQDVDESSSQQIWNVIKAKHFGVMRNHVVGLVEKWDTAMVVVGAFTTCEEATKVRDDYVSALKPNPIDENEGDGMDDATGLPVDFFVMPARLYTPGAVDARGRGRRGSVDDMEVS